MRKDLRRQTFSKPEKPSDEEIKRVTAEANEETDVQILDAGANQTEPQATETTKIQTTEMIAVKQAGGATKKTNSATKQIEEVETAGQTPQISSGQNPFLLSRGQASEIVIEKTGYRVRSDYMDLMKLVKRIKKGHTLEAVLDDALTFYFENSDDGRKAVKQRELLDLN
ncbi:MAG: hypothetical protein H7Z37_10695 [Pyrinomonadaceae bacterium]|nr:hypothetical protein [Pyrinomonadaceae bacterium]